jgi:penicillin-binding protein 2
LSNYLDTADIDWYKQRIAGFLFLVMAAFFLLGIRLFHLQVIKGEMFRRLSENNCIRLQSLDAPRGLIVDRDGKTLVDNRPSFNLSIIVKDADPIRQTLDRLARHIDLPESALIPKLLKAHSRASYKPVLLKKDIGRDTLAVIEAHKYELPGVVVDVKPVRHYVHKQSAAHLLGYLGEINNEELKRGRYPGARGGDVVGKFGVEKTYEQILKGERGGRQVEVNASGQVVRVIKTVDAQPGHNIHLTIDLELQRKTETLLEGKAGAVVALEPSTGHVLAMASSPTFDLNQFVDGMSHKTWNELISNPFRPLENKVLQAEYPPASTYKVVTAMAGLEEKVIDENTSFYCPGFLKYGDRMFRCWKKYGHGKVSVVKALVESCDVFFYHVGQKLGVDRLASYARACGLGSPTGISLDHEARGLIPTAAWKKRRTGVSWQGGETLSIAIGQGYNLVTSLQMAVLTAAIGNGGALRTPLILKAFETQRKEMLPGDEIKNKGKLPVSKETLEIIQKGLWGVVNTMRGTARRIRVKGLEICGKTGTVQLVSRKKNEMENDKEKPAHLKDHAWFISYAPAEDPKIAVAVIVEHGEHGSSGAAPLARDLITSYLKHNP